MRTIWFAVVLLTSTSIAQSGDEEKSVHGTHWVKYEPTQVNGTLKGCSLVFMAVTADRAYLNGNWVAINGSIGVRALKDGPSGLALILKIGLRDLQSGKGFERPMFAYLQTNHASTAKARQVAVDGDPGYKLYTYQAAEPSVAAILKDFIDSPAVTIGYNRRQDGIDVLVPIDFTVIDSEYTASQEVVRKHSQEVVTQWNKCVTTVLSDVLEAK